MTMQNRTLMKLCPWLGNASAFSLRKERKLCRKRPPRLLAAFATVAALLLGTTPLHADIIEWLLDFEFSDATPPDGTVTVTLDDHDATGAVWLTVDATGLDKYPEPPPSTLQYSQHVKELYLNLGPSPYLTKLSWDYGGISPDAYVVDAFKQGVNEFKADGDGYFDLLIEFANSGDGRLSAGEWADLKITGDGLSTSSFEYLSAPGGGHGPFYVAAHVGGIGPKDESGWVTTQPVPEASTMILFGSGLVGLLGFARGKVRSRLSR